MNRDKYTIILRMKFQRNLIPSWDSNLYFSNSSRLLLPLSHVELLGIGAESSSSIFRLSLLQVEFDGNPWTNDSVHDTIATTIANEL